MGVESLLTEMPIRQLLLCIPDVPGLLKNLASAT